MPDIPEALIEKAAKAIHALDCCPMSGVFGDCSYPVDAYLEAREAQAALRAVTDGLRADAWDEGYTSGHSRAMRWMSDEPNVEPGPNPYRHEGDRNA